MPAPSPPPSADESADPHEADDPYETARAAPVRGPRSLDRVTAVAAAADRVIVGTAEGLALLETESGRFELLAADGDVSHGAVAAVALGPDGSIWSAHRGSEDSHATNATKAGGVRRFAEDGELLAAWLAEDGLGSDDVTCLALGARRVAACVEGGVAVRDLGAEREWRRLLSARKRPIRIIDLRHDVRRDVVEHASPLETALSASFIGEGRDRLLVGTTDGLLLERDDGWSRLLVPCRVEHRQPNRIVALDGRADGSFAAVLGLARDDGSHAPAGVLEAWPGDDGEWRHRCHAPGIDVPDTLALDVAITPTRVLVATHAGLVRIEGDRTDLLDPLSGAPDAPVTAVSAGMRAAAPASRSEASPEGVAEDTGAGAEAEGAADVAWVGTWGLGVVGYEGDAWRLFELGDGSAERARMSSGRVR